MIAMKLLAIIIVGAGLLVLLGVVWVLLCLSEKGKIRRPEWIDKWLPLIMIVGGVVIAAIALMAGGTASAGYFDAHEARKAAAHQMAEAARELGYTEDSAIIAEAKAHYNAAQDEIDGELDMLGRVVYFEAGSSWISDRHQQLVACVLLNRCSDPRFPDTIGDNVYKRGQYACAGKLYSVSRDKIPERCFTNAKMAAYDYVECPATVVWQAQFKQGKGTYERIGNTYFCY